MTYDLCVDTAFSWDGTFSPCEGDYEVEIHTTLGDYPRVLVSARYTAAVDHAQAAELAVDAWTERYPELAEDSYTVEVYQENDDVPWTAYVVRSSHGEWAVKEIS